MTHHGLGGVKIAADVDAHHALEIGGGGSFYRSDVRHADVVDQNVETPPRHEAAQNLRGARFIRQIAGMRRRLSSRGRDLPGGLFGAFDAEIENVHGGAGRREGSRDGQPDAARSAGYSGSLTVQSQGG